jgi:quercetin dioxygenase-like cupin family protein
MDVQTKPRFGIDSYSDWLEREGLPVARGLAVDLFALETVDWPRYGVKGAATQLDGRGDYCSMFLIELPAAASTLPQRHLYEEIIYVLEGRGSTQLEFADGRKRSFEWGPRSMFAIPLNAKHRHFNASGSARALLASTNNLPIVMNMFHNEQFIFGDTFEFDDRIGKDEYYAGEGDLVMVRQGNNMWETNFVPDLAVIPLTPWGDRGAGGTNIMFVLADGSLHAHISEMAAGTYKKAHRHPAGTHVTCVTGSGYSLLWYEGKGDFERVEWKHGTVFPPAFQQLHQHFVTSREPARYLGTALGSIRYPVTQAMMRTMWGNPGEKQAASLSIKEGGDQIEYEDQDPRIHAIWLEEMRKHNLTPAMDKYIK